MHPKDDDGMANSVDPDQTASSEAVWSWSALFAETYLSQYIEFVRYNFYTFAFPVHVKHATKTSNSHDSSKYFYQEKLKNICQLVQHPHLKKLGANLLGNLIKIKHNLD